MKATVTQPAVRTPDPRPVPDWPEQTWARIWAASDALQAAELTRLAQQP